MPPPGYTGKAPVGYGGNQLGGSGGVLGQINNLLNGANQAADTVQRTENILNGKSPTTGTGTQGVVPPAITGVTPGAKPGEAAHLPAAAGTRPAAGAAAGTAASVTGGTEERIEVKQVLKTPEAERKITDEEFAKKATELATLIRGHQKISNEELTKLCSGYIKTDRTGKFDKDLKAMLDDKAFDGVLTDDQKRYVRARAVAGERGVEIISKDLATQTSADSSTLMKAHLQFQHQARDKDIPPEMAARAGAAAERAILSYNLARSILSGNETQAASLRIDGDPSRQIPDTVSDRKTKLMAALTDKDSQLLGDPAIRAKLSEIPATRFTDLADKLDPFFKNSTDLVRNQQVGREMLALSFWGERVASAAKSPQAGSPAETAAPGTQQKPADAAAVLQPGQGRPNDSVRIDSFKQIAKDGSFGGTFNLDKLNLVGRDDVWISETNRIVVAKPAKLIPAGNQGDAPASAGTAAANGAAPKGAGTAGADGTKTGGTSGDTEVTARRAGAAAKEATSKIPVVGGVVGTAVDLGNGVTDLGKRAWGWLKPKSTPKETPK